jgi:hypothetical protein
MSVGSNSELPQSHAADSVGGRAFLARVWGRGPVVVRAVVVGFVVLVAGNFLPQGLFAANLKSPAVPWSAVLIAGSRVRVPRSPGRSSARSGGTATRRI